MMKYIMYSAKASKYVYGTHKQTKIVTTHYSDPSFSIAVLIQRCRHFLIISNLGELLSYCVKNLK